MTRASRRIATWLAIWAMALNALWPVIANAKPGYADFQQEICSANMAQVSDSGGSKNPPGTKHLTPHCAFCTTGGGTIAATQPTPAVLANDAVESRPAFNAGCAPAQLDHHPAQPRAPPSAS